MQDRDPKQPPKLPDSAPKAQRGEEPAKGGYEEISQKGRQKVRDLVDGAKEDARKGDWRKQHK